MKIESTWFTTTMNAFCINCRNSVDERRCPWAAENKKPPSGAISFKLLHSDTIRTNKRLKKEDFREHKYTERIILCPNYVSDTGERMSAQEFERLKDVAIVELYKELDAQRRKAARASTKNTKLIRMIAPIIEAAEMLKQEDIDVYTAEKMASKIDG